MPLRFEGNQEGECTDSDELGYGDQATHNGVSLYLHVTGELSEVGQHHGVPNPAVVTHMNVGHDERIVTHGGDAAARCAAEIERRTLADPIAVADDQARVPMAIVPVLRGRSQRRAALDVVVFTNDHLAEGAAQAHVGFDHRVGADSDLAGDYAVRSDIRRGRDRSLFRNDGRGMNAQ